MYKLRSMLLRVMHFVPLWPYVSCKRHLDPALRQYLYGCWSPMTDVGAFVYELTGGNVTSINPGINGHCLQTCFAFVYRIPCGAQGVVCSSPGQGVLSTTMSDVQSDARHYTQLNPTTLHSVASQPYNTSPAEEIDD